MTYLHRKFSQVRNSLNLEDGSPDTGVIESLEYKIEALSNVVSVLIGLLEREGVLSLENAQLLSRAHYSTNYIDGLEEKDD